MTTTVRDLLLGYAVTALGDKRGGFTWVPSVGRYRDNATGRFISEQRVLSMMERYTENYVQPNIERLTQRFIAGQIDLSTWQNGVARELKDSYIVQMQAGRGGKAVTDFSDYGRIGARLRQEYRHLNEFAQAIQRGELSDAQILARAKQYAEGSRVAYFDGQTAAKRAAAYNEERRVLNPAEHCEDCIAYAAEGWKPIGYFPPPGVGSQCFHNCKCDKEYRAVDELGNVIR